MSMGTGGNVPGGGSSGEEVPTVVAPQFSRRRMLIGAGTLAGSSALAVLGTGLASTAVFAAEADDPGKVKLLRWDLITITKAGVVVGGGTDVAQDSATGDTVTLTGSGQAEPHEHEANGGGTFTHRDSQGNVRASGSYFVTGFRDFEDAGGSLVGSGLVDGIGELDETRGGILTMSVRLLPAGGKPHHGIMTVDCSIPGVTFPITEGITLSVADTPLKFVQKSGGTLFHLLQGGSSE